MDRPSGGLWKGLNPQGDGSGWLVAEWKQSPSLTSGSFAKQSVGLHVDDHHKSFILQLWFHSLSKHSKEELLPFTHQPWVNCGPWDQTIISSRNFWSFKDITMQPGFHLSLTSFSRNLFTVRIPSPRAWWKDTEETQLWCLWLLRGNSCGQVIYFLCPGHMLVASETILSSTWACGYH